MRAVVDTNVLIAAALYVDSTPRKIVDRICVEHDLVFSPSTFAEVEQTLLRPKFDGYIAIVDRIEYIAMLYRAATWIEPTEVIRACRDARDDKFLEAAVAGGAAYIVTGDNDLLALDPFRGIRIVRPAIIVADLRR